jgi:predicted PurR-regulated permease PerM
VSASSQRAPEPEPPRTPDPRAGSVVARVGGGLALVAATIFVLRPFLVPIVWAGILVYVTWPVYRAVRRRTARPRLAAALLTVAAAIVIGLPVAWVLVALAQEASHLLALVRDWLDAGAPYPGWVVEHPWLHEHLVRLRAESIVQPTAIARYATTYAAGVSGRLVSIAGGLAANAFKFAITLTTLYFFYVDGERIIEHARRLARVMFPQARDDLLPAVGAVVRAVVFGLLGTALLQGAIGGLGYAIFGVPSPVALGALTTVGSFLPMGPVLVWGGASLWLLANGHLAGAVGMAVWGAALVSTVDNFVRPILISGGPSRIPFLLVFFGVLGGLFAFGMLGLFVGPVLLSVTFALASEFAARAETT